MKIGLWHYVTIIMRACLFNILVFLIIVFTTIPAHAQSSSNCASRDQVIERLATEYGETRQSIGLAPNNSVVEVFASLETGTWTITVTTPAGMTCLVASGQAFEVISEELEPTGLKI